HLIRRWQDRSRRLWSPLKSPVALASDNGDILSSCSRDARSLAPSTRELREEWRQAYAATCPSMHVPTIHADSCFTSHFHLHRDSSDLRCKPVHFLLALPALHLHFPLRWSVESNRRY